MGPPRFSVSFTCLGPPTGVADRQPPEPWKLHRQWNNAHAHAHIRIPRPPAWLSISTADILGKVSDACRMSPCFLSLFNCCTPQGWMPVSFEDGKENG